MAIRDSDLYPGFIEDTQRKIIVPKSMTNVIGSDHPFDKQNNTKSATGRVTIRGDGVHFQRDDYTAILKLPPYGSGIEDLMSRAFIGGWVANTGYAGVVDPVISSLITKLIMKAGTLRMIITGRRLARRRTIELLNRADDSRLGWDDFARNVVAGLLIDNRGVAVARLPIYSTPFNMWSDKGFAATPIEGMEEETKDEEGNTIPRFYWLDATDRAMRRSQTLETVDVIDIKPTGDPNWPFWIHKKSSKKGAGVWVLVSGNVAQQILVTSAPKNSLYRGVAQSGMYRYMSVMVKDLIIQDSVFEEIILQPPKGFLWGVGLDNPTQLYDAMVAHQKDLKESGARVYKGMLIGGSEAENANIIVSRWSSRPEGFTEQDWKAYKEDLGAQCVHSSITEVGRVQAGRGAATQATLNVESEALFGFFALKFEQIANWATEGTTAKAILKSSRATMTHNETVRTLMAGVLLAQDAGEKGKTVEGEANVFSPQEIRALYDQSGIDTPITTGDSDTEMLDAIRGNRIKQRVYRKLNFSTALECGDYVVLPTLDLAVVEEVSWSGNVWIKTLAEGAELLYRTTRLKKIDVIFTG